MDLDMDMEDEWDCGYDSVQVMNFLMNDEFFLGF